MTSTRASPATTNFKNCVHVLERNLEQLLLLQHRLADALQRTFLAVVSQYQRLRPDRSFPRRSLRPNPKWHPSTKENYAPKPLVAPIRA